jgi:adenylate cyclase
LAAVWHNARMIQHCHRLKAHRTIIDGLIAGYRGRIFNTAGDSIIADFPSAVDAVQCAVAVQEAIGKEDANRPAGEPMLFRIGIHVGDVIVEGNNLFGNAVNITARLEALAEPGGICVSGTVRDHIGTKLLIDFADRGEQRVKNIAQPIRAYRVGRATGAMEAPSWLPLPDKLGFEMKIALGPVVRFATDSPVEGDGFEPSVPRRENTLTRLPR